MFDSTVTIALWLALVVGGGSLWLNAIARGAGSRGFPGAGRNPPAPRGGASQAGDFTSDAPRGRLAIIPTDRQR